MTKEKIAKYLPWLFFIAVAGGWILFYLLRVERLLDADMSSEMVLSRILADEHGVITGSWKYSTEIRVLNNQLIFSLFLGLTNSFRISRLLSGVVLLLIYGASYYYLCAQAGLKKYFPHTAALLFLPFSADYAYIILYGLYYIPHIAISFTTAALTLHISKTSAVGKRRILLLLLILLSFAAGLGGARQLVICYLPLLAVALIWSVRQQRIVWTGGYAAVLGGAAGYLVNSFVLSKSYQFNGWTNLSFTDFSFARAEELIMGLLHEYGYTEEGVFSLALVKNAACFVIMAGILIYYGRYFKKSRERATGECFLAELILSMGAIYFLLYLFTDMYYEDRYALPYIVFAAPMAGFGLLRAEQFPKLERKKKGAALFLQLFCDRLLPLGVMAAVVVAGLGRIPGLWRTDLTTELKQLSDALVAQGYESGYASYWNGNIMTELSEGRFEMFNWDDYVDGKVDVEELYIWLQPVSHVDKKPEGKVFILLSAQEELECPLVRYLSEDEVAFRNAGYVAYGFESYEAMLEGLTDYDYDLSDTEGLEEGEIRDGAWVLYEDGWTSGPNMTLYTGSYEFRVSGRGLEELWVEAAKDFGEEELEATVEKQTDEELILTLSVPENSCHVEFYMYNLDEDNIYIESAQVRRK